MFRTIWHFFATQFKLLSEVLSFINISWLYIISFYSNLFYQWVLSTILLWEACYQKRHFINQSLLHFSGSSTVISSGGKAKKVLPNTFISKGTRRTHWCKKKPTRNFRNQMGGDWGHCLPMVVRITINGILTHSAYLFNYAMCVFKIPFLHCYG